jgi:hypothetical protein
LWANVRGKVYNADFSLDNMKGAYVLLLSFVLSLGFAEAATCNLKASVIFQEPYPAMPGKSVDVVFQLTGVDNPECGDIYFKVIEKYPFTIEGDEDGERTLTSGVYLDDFSRYWNLPYRINVDSNALDGNAMLEVGYLISGGGQNLSLKKKFNITIDDVRTDFEISVKDFDKNTNTLTFEILNIGEHDADALTIIAQNQESVEFKGSSRNIVGDLDANEDTTFSFEAIPNDGEIVLDVLYTDEISERRELQKTVLYESSYFSDRKRDEEVKRATSFYVAIGLAVLMLLIWFREKWKKKKEKHKRMREHHLQHSRNGK